MLQVLSLEFEYIHIPNTMTCTSGKNGHHIALCH